MLSIFWEASSSVMAQPVASLIMATLLALVFFLYWSQGRKVRKLERLLANQQRFLRQELNMVSQSAMGVGNRVKYLEKQLKRQPKAFEQALAQTADKHSVTHVNNQAKAEEALAARQKVGPQAEVAPVAARSRAEQALDLWLQDSRHIA